MSELGSFKFHYTELFRKAVDSDVNFTKGKNKNLTTYRIHSQNIFLPFHIYVCVLSNCLLENYPFN